MPQKIEIVPITKSRLYRLGRKRDLADLLALKLSDLITQMGDDNFQEWSKKSPNKKDRIIEEPLPHLAETLKRLHILLRKIETPPYLMSGKMGVKPRDNAEFHSQNGYMINIDIEAFYQSTKREFVYSAFKNIFGHTDDVASLLANLVTYKGHIPTGTATSQIIAFWAYKQTFDRIYKLCAVSDIQMTVWVDDITFSSKRPFPKNWVKNISKIMAEVGLKLKTKKTKIYKAYEYKTATGSAISPSGDIAVKNEKRKELVDILKGRRVEDLSLLEVRSLFGKLVAQRQNEKNFFDEVYSRCRQRLKKLSVKKKQIAKSIRSGI